MNPIERLNRVRTNRAEMQRLLIKIEELENLATRITPVLSKTPKGDSASLKDDTWATLIDYKDTCRAELDEYIRNSKELTDELSCIRSSRIRTAMKYRYVDCCKVEDIARQMNYDERSVYIFLRKGKNIYCEVYRE